MSGQELSDPDSLHSGLPAPNSRLATRELSRGLANDSAPPALCLLEQRDRRCGQTVIGAPPHAVSSWP